MLTRRWLSDAAWIAGSSPAMTRKTSRHYSVDISHCFSYIPLRIKARPEGRRPVMPDGRGESGSKRWRPAVAAKNRGGAPGGAARPKQAVRASESFCGARHARSASEWQHSPAWRGPEFWRLPALHSPSFGEIREMVWQNSDAHAPRE